MSKPITITGIQFDILCTIKSGETTTVYPNRNLKAAAKAGRIAFNRKIGKWELTEAGKDLMARFYTRHSDYSVSFGDKF